MIYVVDSNSFRVMRNFYPDHFPSFWEHVDRLVGEGRLTSVREVAKELDRQNDSVHISEWVDRNRAIFAAPSEEELEKVAEILAIPHFQQLIGTKQRLRGWPVADPFLVARAIVEGSCVVSEEGRKENAAKIPNVCDHFSVECIALEGLMEREGWRY